MKPKKNQTFNSVNNELVVGVYKKGFYNYNSVTNSFKNQVSRNEFIYGAHQIKPLNTTFYALGESLVIIKNGKKRIIDFTKFNKQKIFINEIGRKLVYYNNSLYGNFAFGINKLKKKRIKPKKRIPVSKTKRKEFIDLFSK